MADFQASLYILYNYVVGLVYVMSLSLAKISDLQSTLSDSKIVLPTFFWLMSI